MVKTVRAVTSVDVNFKETEGNYTAFIEMADGTPVTMVMNGYGFFSTRGPYSWMSTRAVRRLTSALLRLRTK
jgi:hypothetical protein